MKRRLADALRHTYVIPLLCSPSEGRIFQAITPDGFAKNSRCQVRKN
ncbi:MAG: hypothetical protein H6Q43_2588 [Deltaproteobacteria bacterium]|nr:hypothetical protein [Deltaproteobacteria bacterium]